MTQLSFSAAREVARLSGDSIAAAPPAMPRTLEETGLSLLFVSQLVCKIFYQTGPQRLVDLGARARLPLGVLEQVITFIRRERMCEVTSASSGVNLVYGLTDLGRKRAEEYLRICQYAGPAPVSLHAYSARVRRQALTDLTVTREATYQAFDGVVIRDEILDQFGAALNSGRAIFLHGPAGSGKSFIAEKLARLFATEVYVPYAILVGNQVIQLLAPPPHHGATIPLSDDVSALVQARAVDPRWVLGRRPVVVAGGELTLDMLDLQFDEGARFYAAPPQLRANNGLFVIDDLGRQRVRARELMNRWIVPLDRRIDYLTLHTGEKFTVPFDVTVVFCTNMSPAELADDAFLRRLGYKIYLGALNELEYSEVCAQVCELYGIAYSEDMLGHLVARFRREGKPLLACTPRDLLGQIRDHARYCGVEPELSRDLLDWAWNNYFINEQVDLDLSL